MIHAYDKSYLGDVMSNLGAMMEYGTCALGYSAEEIYSLFISSGIAGNIERGHPRYLAGLSGFELALIATGKEPAPLMTSCHGPEYWAGWALAGLQWETGRSFWEFELYGLGIRTVIDMYEPYHEADITKFLRDAQSIMDRRSSECPPLLKRYRKAAGLTQEELALKSGTSVRAIRSYEENARSLSRAESGALQNLSRALGCRMEDLL